MKRYLLEGKTVIAKIKKGVDMKKNNFRQTQSFESLKLRPSLCSLIFLCLFATLICAPLLAVADQKQDVKTDGAVVKEPAQDVNKSDAKADETEVAAVQGQELVLVEKGVSLAPIIVYENAPPKTLQAANELADYIRKISGATPKVIMGKPDPIPEKAIWVGFQPELKKLFPGVDFDFKYPEEILIAANGKHLVIAGRDRWDPKNMDIKGARELIIGKQQEYGTANAVYTFLQDYLQVRWFWPGEMGEDILPQKKIGFAPFEFRYHPQIIYRSGMFIKLSLGNRKEGPPQVWARHQRLQLDSFEIDGGHGFTEWWEKYHKTHPEYFALQPNGTRSGFPSPNKAKLCSSNPAVWDRWLSEAEDALKADPTKRVFNAAPNDGWAAGHCVCEKCRAWDNPKGELVDYFWEGHRENRPALSDQQVIFANTLARMLKKRFPDKQLYVQIHAYGLSRPPPVAAVPDDNVIISSVANFHMRGEGEGDDRSRHMNQFKGWAQKAPLIVWRPNLGNPVGLSWGMPDVAMNQAGEDFRFVADNHCIGLFFDMFWEHWATQGPHYYIVAQLAWNPRINVQTVMNDYYKRAFGPASAELKAYWELMEDTRQKFVKEDPARFRAYNIPSRYTPELLAKARTLLQQADAKLANSPEIYRKRVAFVRSGFEYACLVVDTRAWMQKVEQSKGQNAEVVAKVKANWNTAAQMSKTALPFSIDYQATFLQPMNKRMVGLHPDNQLQGRMKKDFEKGLE